MTITSLNMILGEIDGFKSWYVYEDSLALCQRFIVILYSSLIRVLAKNCG